MTIRNRSLSARARAWIELGSPPEIAALMARHGERIVALLDRDAIPSSWNCHYSTLQWAKVLASAGVAAQRVEGLYDDGNALGTPSETTEHCFLLVGPRRRIFDPTAAQFEHPRLARRYLTAAGRPIR